jgi:hypothetical protein
VSAREVVFYWPFKIARLLHLKARARTLVVDPDTDIGIPFNNYTAMYPMLAEVGPRLGPAAWIALAWLLRLFSRTALRYGDPAWTVAAAAPVAMAIRTPWNNTFFDGTLVAWLAVAAGAWLVSRPPGAPALSVLYDRRDQVAADVSSRSPRD